MNSLIYNKIILHNFGSYGHAEVELRNKGFCLVSGKNNYKKDNALSNGSGKSFLWSAICYALTGETIGGLTSHLRNINIEDDDTCYVTLYLTVDGSDYIITRHHTPKSDLKIIKDGNDESGKGIRESEKHLGELLPDLTKDLIASTIIIGQGMPHKFSAFSPSGRKELLEKLTKSDFMIEDIKNRIQARQLELDKQVRTYEDSILVNKTQLGTAQKALETAQNELAEFKPIDYNAEIKIHTDKLAELKKDLAANTKELSAAEKIVEELNKKILELTSQKAGEVSLLAENYNKKYRELIGEKSQVDAELSSVKKEIAHVEAMPDVCPTCKRPFEPGYKPDITDKKKLVETLTKKVSACSNKITDCNKKNAQYTTEINQRYDADISAANTKLTEAKKEITRLKNNDTDISHFINLEEDEIRTLSFKKENDTKHLTTLALNIKKYEKDIADLEKAIQITDQANAEIAEHLAVLRKMDTLVKRDFRGYLLTNIITYLDKRAKDYSELVFGTRELNVYLDGNALDISYCNKLMENLSGGEKQRVDIILQLALRDLLSVYLNYSANILVLDEIFDNLDRVATDRILNLISSELKDIESIFIISHHADSLNIGYDSEILVVKDENGISAVI